MQRKRDAVDIRGVLAGEDAARLEIGEQCDLVLEVARNWVRGAADDDVGRDTDAPQLVDRVLRRLRLQFARGLDHRHERAVHVADVVFADLVAQLTNRLEERQALNVADGAANLDEHDVDGLGLRDTQDAALDLVGDVRDDLNRRTEVLATTLATNHAVVDRAGRGVRESRRVFVDKALVVAKVEVGLGTVLSDEHLAMLKRAHRAGIDIDVRVQLDHRDAHPAVFQNPTE